MTPDVHMLTGPFVLNALPEDERIGFETHLAGCSSCLAEVTELREAANKLGSAVAMTPPPSLKARVLAEVATTRQLPPLLRDTAPHEAEAEAPVEPAAATQWPAPVTAEQPAVPAAVPAELGVAGRHAAAPRRYRRRSVFALAAAALVVAGTGGVAIDQYRDTQQVQQQNQDLAALLSQPDTRTRRDDVQGGGQATMVMSARQDRAIVLLHGLPALPRGKTYQLWLMDRSEVPHSAGLAKAEDAKLIRGDVNDKVMLGVTVEDAAGAVTPTLPILAKVQLA